MADAKCVGNGGLRGKIIVRVRRKETSLSFGKKGCVLEKYLSTEDRLLVTGEK